MDAETDKIAKAICWEQCAFHGEPPCWSVAGAAWPNPECNEPGCVALAKAAITASNPIQPYGMRRVEAPAISANSICSLKTGAD